MEPEEFESVVAEAIDELPEEFQKKLDNIAVMVEDEISDVQRARMNLPEGSIVFGLYEGIPRTKRGTGYVAVPPDKIFIFRTPIVRFFPEKEQMIRQIKDTVLHEIGHYFGMTDEELRRVNK